MHVFYTVLLTLTLALTVLTTWSLVRIADEDHDYPDW